MVKKLRPFCKADTLYFDKINGSFVRDFQQHSSLHSLYTSSILDLKILPSKEFAAWGREFYAKILDSELDKAMEIFSE